VKLPRLKRRPLHIKLTASQARAATALHALAGLAARYSNLDGRHIRIDLTIRNEETTNEPHASTVQSRRYVASAPDLVELGSTGSR
jgi:hypothetical protein